MVIVGHRGACGYEPENTLASFAKALALHVDMIECDVQYCASGEPVVIHDDTVDRTTNGEGFVAHIALPTLQKLDAGNGQSIPTVQEVIELVQRRAVLDIEIKDPRALNAVGTLITEYSERKHWSYDDFLITSFNHQLLVACKEQFPAIEVAPVFERFEQINFSVIKTIGAKKIVMDYRAVNDELMTVFDVHAVAVFVYTVNDPQEAVLLQRKGVAGIISDYPDRIAQELIQHTEHLEPILKKRTQA
jgi:glycerophosphoryl diester phosphodiesterase